MQMDILEHKKLVYLYYELRQVTARHGCQHIRQGLRVFNLLGEEAPFFSKQRVNFSPTHPLTHLVMANNNIVMANRSIIRIDQATPDKLEEIDLTNTILQANISNLFLDPTGAHLLISLKPSDVDGQPELYYLSKKWNKPKLCTKFRGNLVSAVGWSHENRSETSTGPVLAGTTLGVIIETELASDDRMFSRDVGQHWKQVFNICRGQHVPVTGLKYFQVPQTNKYFVVATTPTRMYQFKATSATSRIALSSSRSSTTT